MSDIVMGFSTLYVNSVEFNLLNMDEAPNYNNPDSQIAHLQTDWVNCQLDSFTDIFVALTAKFKQKLSIYVYELTLLLNMTEAPKD